MNKETKVGLLVGLSFIVLFGVILSNQAPDIVVPPEKPMLAPMQPHRTDAQVVRQIEPAAPAPEPVDVVVDAGTQAPVKEPAAPGAATADASPAPADAAKPAVPPAGQTAGAPEAGKAVTADQLGPEVAEAEPGDDGVQMISQKVDPDGTKTTVYVVKSGDSLAKISRQVYGVASSRNIDKLYEANKDKMPNKKSLQVGMKLHLPTAPAKEKSSEDLMASGKFDEVAETKPAGTTKVAPAAKDAEKETAAAKEGKDTKEAKDPQESSKQSKAPAAGRTAVAEVSQETIENILLKHKGGEAAARPTPTDLARLTEPVEKVAEKKEADAKDSEKSGKADKKEADKTCVASREDCKHYQIQKGDTWYKLAARFLGDSKRWHDLQAMNDDILPDAGKLRTGVKIRVPAGAKGRLDLVVE